MVTKLNTHMKSKIIKIGFLASFLIVQFFGFGFLPKVFAGSCTLVNANWFIQNSPGNNSPASGTVTASPTQTYLAVANVTGCVGNGIQFDVYGGNYSQSRNFTPYNVTSSVSSSPEQHNVPVNFSLAGTYYFKVFAVVGNSQTLIGQSPSLQVTVTANTASTATTNDLQGYNQCILAGGSQASCSSKYLTPAYQQAYNSCIAAGNSAITCATAGASCSGGPGQVGTCSPGYICSAATGGTCSLSSATTLYGCPAATTGVYACATSQSSPDIAACLSLGPLQIIDQPAKCGCTQATYEAGTCKNGKPTTPAAGGMASNSLTTLYNPIEGQDNLTALVVNIMKGFLGIVAVWAVAFIVIGGFRMVISSGNEEAVLVAKKTITWAVLGLLIAVLSFAIIAIVQNLVGVKVPPPATPSSYNIQPETKT